MSSIRETFDFVHNKTRRIALMFLYLGWEHDGLARQANLQNTIEQHLFTALLKTKMIESIESCKFTKCGRTDKGVSAFRQVVAFTVRSIAISNDGNGKNDSTNELPYINILNRVLPKTIRCICWAPVPNDFSARHDCIERIYTYVFPRSLIRNIRAINEACQHLIGQHDFRNFCHINRNKLEMTFFRRINAANVEAIGPNESSSPFDLFKLTIKASGFLWHQIRCIVTLLYEIGCGNEEPELIRQLLDIEQFPSRPAYNLANELPLCLFDCNYPRGALEWEFDREAISALIKTLQRFWAEYQVKATNIKMMLNEVFSLAGNLKEEPSFAGLDTFVRAGPSPKEYKKIAVLPRCNGIDKLKEKLETKKKTMKRERTNSNIDEQINEE